MEGPRIIAIDWSGRSGRDQRRTLWLAETTDGQLVRLENGRTRAEIVQALVAEKQHDPRLIVGLDFAFSLPAWYLQERGLTARTLWAALAEEALTPAMRRLGLARWLNTPELPFWMTGAAHRLVAPQQELRRTAREVHVPGVSRSRSFSWLGRGRSAAACCTGCKLCTASRPAAFKFGRSTRQRWRWSWKSFHGSSLAR